MSSHSVQHRTPALVPALPRNGASEPATRAAGAGALPLRWIVIGLLIGTVLAVWPLWLSLVLAAWSAALVRPLYRRLGGWLHGRRRAAALVSVALVVLVLAPLGLLGAAIATSIRTLIRSVQSGGGPTEAFLALTASDGALPIESVQRAAFDFLQGHGGEAMSAAAGVLGALGTVSVQGLVFVYSFYTFMVYRRPAYAWLVEHAPIPASQLERLVAAFFETGRALLVGLGATALVQGAVASVAYALIGLPQPLLLGALTGLSSLLPVVGTALVWGPTSFVLYSMGDVPKALALLGVGLVIGTIDNILRPALARYAQLRAPTYVVLIAMLGGLAAFGGGGLLLGPLVVRLLLEALAIGRTLRNAPMPAGQASHA